MGKISHTHTDRLIDEEGVIKETRTSTTFNNGSEPPYVKLYLDDILYLSDVPKGHNSVLLSLLKYMTYAGHDEPQVIYTNSVMKMKVAKDLEVSVSRIDNVISDLTKAKLFKRIGRGTYQVNPMFFGRGDWNDISQLRLTITFDSNGKTVMGEVKKKTTKDKLRLVK